MNPLFSVFVSKLPTNVMNLLPTGNKFITFLNPYSLFAAREYALKYKEFDYIASDGILPVWMNSFFHVSKTIRCSFDMAGIAGLIFKYAISEKKRIYFWGTTSENLTKFLKVIRQNYPSLQIAGWHHGYVESLEERIWEDIQNSNADIIIIGMGTPKQDLMALKLKEKGYMGSVYTCGGFLHQTIEKINYYPFWINKLNLRSMYRLYKEPETLKRFFKTYPKFLFSYSYFLIKTKYFSSGLEADK